MSDISKKMILLVEDEIHMAAIISKVFKNSGFDVITAENGEQAIEIMNSRQDIHLILMDIVLGYDIDGIETARIILQDHDIPIIFLSGYSNMEILQRAEQVSSYGFILKQGDYHLIMTSIKMALNLYNAHKKIEKQEALLRKKKWFDSIILESVSDGVLVVSKSGKILFVNQTLENIFGYSSEELIGSKLTVLMPESLWDKHIAAFNGYIETGNKHLPCWTGLFLPGLHKKGYEISLEVSWSENNSYGQQVFCGIIKDVTERIQTQEKLRKSEEAFHAMFADNPISMLVYEPKTLRILEVNAMAIEHYGYSRDEFLTMTIADMRPPEDIPKLLQKVAEVGKGVNRTGTWHHRKKDGTVIDVEIISHSVNYFGKEARLVLANDVTERKKAEDTIRHQNEFLHTVINSLEHPFYVVNADTYIVEIANKATHPNLPENMTCYELLHHLNAPCKDLGLSCTAEEVKLTQKPAITEHVHYYANGEQFYTEVRSYPIFDKNGNVNKVIEYCLDITERKEAEIALRKLTDELEFRVAARSAEVLDLYNNAPCGYHSLDHNGLFVMMNDTELKWLGYDREEIIGKKKFTDLVTEKGIEQFQKIFNMFNKQEYIKNLEYDMIRKDGTIMPVLLNATSVRDADGNFVFSRSTLFDITERKQADEMLRRQSEEIKLANAALEKAARLKDEFLASMSHELRTPLTGVLSLSEALLEQVYGTLNEKQLKILRRIEESGQHLLDLINDILDLSKVEAGQMTLQIEKTSVTDICQSALHLVRGMANKKRHTISFSTNPASMSIDADPRRMKQMILNLLSNAVKFTPDGGQISLNVIGNEKEHYTDFIVSDNGIGIAPEKFPMLFRPFVQLDSSLSRQYSGTGLGLSLIQRMAELHGGSVMVESEVGQGSQFTIRLPWNIPAQLLKQPTDKASAEVSKKSAVSEKTDSETLIMLAEDNQINISIYSDYLQIKGYQVVVAKHGQEAVQKARNLQPKLILMDIQMPGMNGLEAIKILRADKDHQLASTPIIALTSLAMPGDRERCLSLGANEYLSKPVSMKHLTELIAKFLKNRR